MLRSTTVAAVLLAVVMAGGASGLARAATAPTTLAVGVTHTQRSLDGPSSTADARGQALLNSKPGTLQNVHLMGWGTRNPEPTPGVYDWTDLDRRIALVRRTGGTPVITLCCSPDWMAGGTVGATDWSRLGTAPLTSHFADFAALARQVALRYPDVRYFQVWNEMKGFWSTALGRWRYEDYTALYNQVYDALRSVRPDVQVGGPYVSLTSRDPGTGYASSVSGPWGVIDQRDLDVVTYWLQHEHGAGFVAVDGSVATRSGRLLVPAAQATDKFRALTAWLRARTTLPIWWSELYAVPYGNPTNLSDGEQQDAFRRAFEGIEAAGASVALFWQPEGTGTSAWRGLWTPTSSDSGGRATVLWTTATPWLHRLSS